MPDRFADAAPRSQSPVAAWVVTTGSLSWDVVSVDKPDDVNVVIGQAHFIKTVEDLHEAMVGVGPSLPFGLAFCEASGPRLVRRTGNDDGLIEIATRTALTIAAGHCFLNLFAGVSRSTSSTR